MEQGYIPVDNVHANVKYPFLGDTTRELLDTFGVNSFQGVALRVGDRCWVCSS